MYIALSAASTTYKLYTSAVYVTPIVGGYLVAGPGWRWVFLINLPVALLIILFAQRHVPESRDPNAPAQLWPSRR